MKRMHKRAAGNAMTFYFLDPSVSDAASGVRWIAAAADLEGFVGKAIELKTSARDGAGEESALMDPASTPEAIMARLEGKAYDRISLKGKYDGVTAALGVDLRNNEITITVPDEHMKLIGMIVERLNNRGQV